MLALIIAGLKTNSKALSSEWLQEFVFVDTYPEGDIYVDVSWTKRLDDFENRRLAGQQAIEVRALVNPFVSFSGVRGLL